MSWELPGPPISDECPEHLCHHLLPSQHNSRKLGQQWSNLDSNGYRRSYWCTACHNFDTFNFSIKIFLLGESLYYDCSIRIPYWCWFLSWLLHLQSNSLIMAWESTREWFKSLCSFTHVREPEEIPASWLPAGSVLAIVITCRVNQWTSEGKISLCVSPSL